MRLAVLADIHGNLPALEAVLERLEALQPDMVLLNGDLINAIPFSRQVVERVQRTDWAVVRGNHEFYLLDFDTERAPADWSDPDRWGGLHWLAERFPDDQLNYLAALPDERTLYFPRTQPIRMAHGVPGHNRTGFYQQMPAEKILHAVEDIEERTVISAHSHVQVDRHVSIVEGHNPLSSPHDEPQETRRYVDGYHGALHQPPSTHWHIVNPGSVGLPLNGDVRAQFALLHSVSESKEPGGWRVEHVQVPYDRRPALAEYEVSGLLAAGGVIAQLFYWELVTAEPEIIKFYRWSRENGRDADADPHAAFAAYCRSTGRDAYIRARDPLLQAET